MTISWILTISVILVPATADNCLSGWFYGGVNTCFKLEKSQKNYNNARSSCRSMGGQLAFVSTLNDSEAIAGELARKREYFALIGYQDINFEGKFSFTDNQYTNWKTGRPKNDSIGNDCVEMTETGQWNDNFCNITRKYICECYDEVKCSSWKFYGRKRLQVYNVAKSYIDARLECFHVGDGLVKIESQQENSYIRSLATGPIWIGFDDRITESLFQWNGNDYTNWNPGEPDNVESREDCVEMRFDGMWNDIPCCAELNSVCQCFGNCPGSGWVVFGSKFLKYVPYRKTQEDASAYCKSLADFASLVMIESETENKVVRGLVRRIPFWIGYDDKKKEGLFQWQGIMPRTRWQKSQPDNWRNTEDCVMITRYGKWKDIRCSRFHPYVCSKPANISTKRNDCLPNPCQNNGVCSLAINGTSSCNCQRGYKGDRCQNDNCSPNPCSNNKVCSLTSSGDTQCSCKPGYSGNRCERNVCSPNPCQNKGTCFIGLVGSVVCSCDGDYWGDRCQKLVYSACKPFPCDSRGRPIKSSAQAFHFKSSDFFHLILYAIFNLIIRSVIGGVYF